MKVNKNTQVRIGAINTLIRQIGSLDRRFYASDQDHETRENNASFSKFFILDGELWFTCSRCKDTWVAKKGTMMKNCNGCTLNTQLEYFRQFIIDGNPIQIFATYWGYRFESLVIVHELAKDLGICKDSRFVFHDYETNKDRYYPEKEIEGITISHKG